MFTTRPEQKSPSQFCKGRSRHLKLPTRRLEAVYYRYVVSEAFAIRVQNTGKEKISEVFGTGLAAWLAWRAEGLRELYVPKAAWISTKANRDHRCASTEHGCDRLPLTAVDIDEVRLRRITLRDMDRACVIRVRLVPTS